MKNAFNKYRNKWIDYDSKETTVKWFWLRLLPRFWIGLSAFSMNKIYYPDDGYESTVLLSPIDLNIIQIANEANLSGYDNLFG